ncbi:RTC4-like domain-containing protein [Phlebopus sp. FC_14]|nr:RTC4-like domain-containing protein [Phlebopus sp. FC_14]
MEKLLNKMKTNDTNIHTEPTNRLSQRPLAVKSGEGVGFQAFESSFGVSKPNSTRNRDGKSSKSKFKPAMARPPPSSLLRAPSRDSLGSSDDELALSQDSHAGNATPPLRRISKGKSQAQASSEQQTVRVNGQNLPIHPEYKPNTVIGSLKFKKKKSIVVEETAPEEPPPSSSLPDPDSQDLSKPILHRIPLGGDTPQSGSKGPQDVASRTCQTRRRDVSPMRSIARAETRSKKQPTASLPQSSMATSSENTQPAAKHRPKPRIVKKAASSGRVDNLNPTSHSPGKHDLALRAKFPAASHGNAKQDLKRPSAMSSARRALQEFPMPRRAKENVSDGTTSADTGKKGKAFRATPLASTSPQVPMPFPLGKKDKSLERQSTFPVLSPLSSPVHQPETPRGKGKARAQPEDEVPARGVARPFPLSSRVLSSIDHYSPMSPIGSSTPTKRTSDDSDADRARRVKKHKNFVPCVFEKLDYLDGPPVEEDSIDIGYAKDPTTICPYCDEDLPAHPTPPLQNLLATARRKSYADPRPRNPRGLKAPLAIYISVCQRHRFETHHLPIAIERGWPTSIDFKKVPDRVKRMKAELEAIILDNGYCDDGEEDDIDDISGGPRSRSVFWREVRKEVRKQGSRTVVGVKGQFASFEKTQPGYYGEQGSNIIHQTLFNLFPPSSFDASLIAPLSPAEFIQRILVPEAAVRLIAQDLCADIGDAIATLRESAQYGVAMFPDTVSGEGKRKEVDMDDDEMGVADQIVMERARVRRRELEEEEKIEAQMMKEEEAAKKVRIHVARREKAMERVEKARRTKQTSEDDYASTYSEASLPRRPARQRTTTANTESDAMSVDSWTSRISTQSSKTPGRTGQRRARAPLVRSDHTDRSDSVEVVAFEPRETGVPTRRARARGIEREAVNTRVRERPNIVPSIDIDDSTPRPRRHRSTTPPQTSPDNLATGSTAARHPLQIARSRGITGFVVPVHKSSCLSPPIPIALLTTAGNII